MEPRNRIKNKSATKGSNATNPLIIVNDDDVDMAYVTPSTHRRNSKFTSLRSLNDIAKPSTSKQPKVYNSEGEDSNDSDLPPRRNASRLAQDASPDNTKKRKASPSEVAEGPVPKKNSSKPSETRNFWHVTSAIPTNHARSLDSMAAAAGTIQSGRNSGFQQPSPFVGPMPSKEAFMPLHELFASIAASMRPQNFDLKRGQEIEDITLPADADRSARLSLIHAEGRNIVLIDLRNSIVRLFSVTVDRVSNNEMKKAKELNLVAMYPDLESPTQDVIASISSEVPG
ncbi:hypothetical protein IFR05_013837 [Cadophora sp. M221]|nr:hypothetical protein IFR05_013837 [Cadophora sp. M221]